MADRTDAVEVDRWVISVTTVASAIFIWRSAFDPFSVPKATAIVLGATVLVALAIRRWAVGGLVVIPVSPLVLAAVAFFVGLLVATGASDNIAISLSGQYKRYSGFFLYSACIIFFLASLRSFSARSVTRLASAQLVAGGLIVGYGLMQWLNLEPYNWQNLYGDAVFSFLGNPNFAGAYAGIAFGVSLWAATNSEWTTWLRIVSGAIAVGAAVVAIVSDSFQGPVTVGAAGAVFLLGWLIYRGGQSLRVGVPVLLAILGVGGALMLAGFGGVGPLERLNEQNTLQLRGYYWGAALNMFSDDPITGVGLDRYAAYYRAARTEEAALNSVFSVSADEPHNVPLDMFAEGGLLLGVPYFAFVAVTGWHIAVGLRKIRGPRLLLLAGLSGSWLAYQLQSLVSIDVAPLAFAHWVLAACIALVVREPLLHEVRLPWAPRPPAIRKRGKTQRAAPRSSAASNAAGYVLGGVVTLLGLVLLLRPIRADIEYQASRIAMASSDREQAFAAAKRSTDIAPWEPSYWFQHGVRRLDSGQEALAAELFAEAIKRDPRGLEQVVSAARTEQARENQKAARALYEQALEIEPYAPEMVLEVGRFSLAAGYSKDAIRHARYLAKVRPEHPDFWVFLGDAYLADDRRTEAMDAYRHALRVAPGDQSARERLEEMEL